MHFCSFIADEEVGGHDGMAKYVLSKEFKDLNIGFALDEGLASEDNKIPLFYGERNVYWVKFKCTGKQKIRQIVMIFSTFFCILGNPGHGSRFIENTAAEKVQHLTNKLLGFREEQKKIYNSSPDMTLGDVTTVNLTYMSGGVQMNVVPNEFTIGFDIRITPTTKLEKFEAMIRKWIGEAGGKKYLFLGAKIHRSRFYIILIMPNCPFF